MGESEDMMESFEHVGQSLMLAVIPIYAILASQFRSFLPLAIMLAAAVADGCGWFAFPGGRYRQHHVDDRTNSLDGTRDQERHPAGGLY